MTDGDRLGHGVYGQTDYPLVVGLFNQDGLYWRRVADAVNVAVSFTARF